MKRMCATTNPAFWHVTIVALGLSLFSVVVFSIAATFLSLELSARTVLVLLSLIYLLLIFNHQTLLLPRGDCYQTGGSAGKLVSLLGWALLVLLLSLVNPNINVWLASLFVLVWLVRCLYCYHRLWIALLDLLVSGLALLLAVATALHTQSLFLSLWSFFLTQSLVVFLPGSNRQAPHFSCNSESFDGACQAAESALRRLIKGG